MSYADMVETKLVEVRKNNKGEYIRATRLTPKDSTKLEQLDIRLMYTAEDGELRPTKQGVRMNSEIEMEIIGGILTAFDGDELIDVLRYRKAAELGMEYEEFMKEYADMSIEQLIERGHGEEE